MRVPLLTSGLQAVGGAVRDATGRLTLAVLDTVLASPHTDEVVRRVLSSPAVERAVGQALSGPLVDAVARDVVRYDVLERMADHLLESPQLEHLVARSIDSRMLDAATTRLLESEELWILVEEIARSPAVTEAIGRQGAGFADQVAGEVRIRSARVDARLERAAQRLIGRRPAR